MAHLALGSLRSTNCSPHSVLVTCGARTCHGLVLVVHGFLFTRGSDGTLLEMSSDGDYSIFIFPLQYLILHLTPLWALNSICWMNKPKLVGSGGCNMLIGCHALKGRSFKNQWSDMKWSASEREAELSIPGGSTNPMILCIWIRTTREFVKLNDNY